MSTDERTNHFAGFSQSLMQELFDLGNGAIDVTDDEALRQEYEQIIARRAYDLVLHTVWQTIPASGSTIKKYQGLTIEQIANMIPDLPELPEVKE